MRAEIPPPWHDDARLYEEAIQGSIHESQELTLTIALMDMSRKVFFEPC
jgi:hypothetical protein